MNVIFRTTVTSERHRKLGFCEESDFATIKLIELSHEEKELIVSFRKYSNESKIEFINVKGVVFQKITKESGLPYFSRKEEAKLIGNGTFSKQDVINIVLKIREVTRNSYSNPSSNTFVLIGKTLYKKYCLLEDLNITTCGNTMFSHWVSVDIEAHGGKALYPLNKESFKAVTKERKKHWEDTKPKGTRGDGHSSYFQPTEITWGKMCQKNKDLARID